MVKKEKITSMLWMFVLTVLVTLENLLNTRELSGADIKPWINMFRVLLSYRKINGSFEGREILSKT